MDVNQLYSRRLAQLQRIRNNLRQNIHAQDAHPPFDGSLLIKVLRYKLDRARRQSFYIIDTPSRKLPQPIIHITGSYGNLYQITFTPTGISCSCDDSSTPCKHILYVLTLLRLPLTTGWIKIVPVQVITSIQSNTLNQQVLDPHSSSLFLHGTSHNCFVCKLPIQTTSNYLVCTHCSSCFHTSCSPLNDNITCINCNQPSSIVPVRILGNHKNFYHILTHLRLSVKKIPENNNTNNNNRHTYHRHPSIRRNQPPYPPLPLRIPLPPPPPPPPLPPPPLPPIHVGSNIHIIPASPTTSSNTDVDQKQYFTRHI